MLVTLMDEFRKLAVGLYCFALEEVVIAEVLVESSVKMLAASDGTDDGPPMMCAQIATMLLVSSERS